MRNRERTGFIDTADPTWWLRTALASALSTMLFGYLAYEDPSYTLGWIIVGFNIAVTMWMISMYWMWPKQ